MLIALSLMSFVLVIVLSLVLMASVETANAANAKDRLLARENARLGLMIALGELQKHAGPDQRVTFRANAILPGATETILNGLWTGVVNADSATNDPSAVNWLVSSADGNNAVPTATLNPTNSFEILSEVEKTNADDPGASVIIPAVRAPLRNIDSTGRNQLAFWISDESQKVSLMTRPLIDGQADEWLDESFGRSNAQRLDQIIPKRTGVEILFASEGGDGSAQLDELEKFSSIRQFELSNQWEVVDWNQYFHDVTSRSYGVLTSTSGTGLRKDLSLRPDLMPLPGNFEAVNDFETYMEEPLPDLAEATPYIPFEADLRRRFRIAAPTTTAVGEISDGIFPVITDFRILFHVHVARDNVVDRTSLSVQPITNPEEIVVRAMVHVELWNPYTSALVPENLVLEINNLPDVTLTFPAARGATISRVVRLSDVLNNSTGGEPGFYIELPFEDRGFANHDDFSWLPGRVYNWVGPNNYSGGSSKNTGKAVFYNRSMNDAIWYTAAGSVAPTNATSFGISAAQANISVALRKKSESDQLDTGPELLRIEDINFDSFVTNNSAFSLTSLAPSFGYQIQRDESGFVALSTNGWDKSRWLRVDDPRNPRPLFDRTGNGIGAYQAPNGLDPSGYTSTGVSQPNFLFDRTAGGSGLRPSEDIPLFELFRHRPISVGELQHLSLIEERPFTIGNSWGSRENKRYNRIFDETFFSGLDTDDTEPDLGSGELLPNHRLRTFAEINGGGIPELATILAAGELSAANFLAEGAFNLNSTSSTAWAAMLGSINFAEWEIANINDSNGDLVFQSPTRIVEIGPTILRFPQSAQEVFHTGQYRDENEPPTEFFRIGAKKFEDSTGNVETDPYRALGNAIAERIKERISESGPFTTIEDFLSPVELPTFSDPNDATEFLSVLERAILDVPEINFSQEQGETVWHHTSNFLSQADVMTGLAPIANVRGDTFYIRSVGISSPGLDPSEQTSAVCEARVQRLPTTADPGDDIDQPNENGFGRRFAITSIRWLEPSEL